MHADAEVLSGHAVEERIAGNSCPGLIDLYRIEVQGMFGTGVWSSRNPDR